MGNEPELVHIVGFEQHNPCTVCWHGCGRMHSAIGCAWRAACNGPMYVLASMPLSMLLVYAESFVHLVQVVPTAYAARALLFDWPLPLNPDRWDKVSPGFFDAPGTQFPKDSRLSKPIWHQCLDTKFYWPFHHPTPTATLMYCWDDSIPICLGLPLVAWPV